MKLNYLRMILVLAVLLLVGVGLGFWWRQRPLLGGELPSLPSLEIAPYVLPQERRPLYVLEGRESEVVTLPVYGYEFSGGGTEERVTKWARTLGFKGLPKKSESVWRGTLYTWTESGKTLVVEQDGSSLSYSVDLLADPEALRGSFLPSFEQAARVVEGILEELGPLSALVEFVPQKSKALKVGVVQVQETALDQAELLEIHFTAKVGDYPLYLESGPELDPVVAWVGKGGKLLRLDYYPVGEVGEKIADYPLKNREEILESLDRGEGVVVSSSLEGGEEIVSTVITRVSLGYLLPPPDVAVLQPIYILQGQAVARSGETGKVVIYLSVIR